MVTPNPRSLGDTFPDDRSLNKDDHSDAADARNGSEESAEAQSTQSDQEFQNPMTEGDVASGGPADAHD
ncbi:MAG: hypothetical protein ACTHZ9_07045 [Leucobacter sp.]